MNELSLLIEIDYIVKGDMVMRKRIAIFALSLLLVFAFSAIAADQAVYATFVQTTGGKVQGYHYDGVDHYFAIQYGVAERFKDPQPYQWENVRVCNVMGEVCPQNTIRTASRDMFNSFGYNLLQTQSEELCLQLNVWTPESNTAKSRPVIVWLHGGGYSTGSSTQFNFYLGETFAKEQDCVFVSVNHRLNCLGFLDVSAIGGEEYDHSGNAGMQDIVLSLEWVKDNIAQFGGDPRNVTIVGQSGGAGKVTTLMSMPVARGLFHKAVAISGGAVQIRRTSEIAQAETAKVVEALNLAGRPDSEILSAMLELSYEELYSACEEAGISRAYGPVVDGDLIPTGNYEMSSNIPLLASNVLGEFSTNYAEVVPFSMTEENHKNKLIELMPQEDVLEAYNEKYGEEYGKRVMDAFLEAYPGHYAAEGLYVNNRRPAAQAGPMPSMTALPLLDAMFSYGGRGFNSVEAYSYPMYGTIVAIHTASSIPFWFGNVEDIPEFVAGDQENAQRVNDDMSRALGAFARNGDPSTEELPWEAYTPENGACMVFDTQSEVKYHHDAELFDLINQANAAKSK